MILNAAVALIYISSVKNALGIIKLQAGLAQVTMPSTQQAFDSLTETIFNL